MFKTFFALIAIFSNSDASFFRKANTTTFMNETRIANHHTLLRTSLARFYKNQPETRWLTRNYTARLRNEQEL